MMAELKLILIKIKSAIAGFIVPILCISISVALVLFVVVPSLKVLPTNSRDINSRQEQSKILKKKVDVLEKLVDFKSVVNEDFVLLSTAIPSESQVPQLLTQIDQISKESGMAIVTMNYTLSNTSVGEVNVTLTATGNYDQIVSFLSNLEDSSRIIELDNLRYGDNKDAEGKAALLVTFVLKSSYLTSNSKATETDSFSLDITDPGFIGLLAKVKDLKIYKYSVEDLKYKQVSESTQSENK